MPNWRRIETFIARALAGDLDSLRRLYGEQPLLVNAMDRGGFNALSRAGSDETRSWLLERGAVAPPDALQRASSAFQSHVGAGNLLRAREHLDCYAVDVHAVQNHHQSTNTTLLHLAAHSPEMTRLVLDSGGDVLLEARTGPGEEGRRAGWTPLHMALRSGHRDTAQVLLDRGAACDVFAAALLDDAGRLSRLTGDELNRLDSYRCTPLHWAALCGSAGAVALLLDRGLAIDATNHFDETPLHLAALAPNYELPGKADRAEVLKLLIDRGATVDVFAASALGDVALLTRLLDADPERAQAVNRFSSTPLHYAAWACRTQAVQLLLDRGADVNAMDRHGMPPMLYAAYWGRQRETVEALLDAGAAMHWKNIWGKGVEAYDAVVDNNHWLARKGGGDIHAAALTGDVDTLRRLLDEAPARVQERSESNATPLHFAASGNQTKALQLLLERGADLEARMDRGISPLYSAARAGAAAAVALLLAEGADPMAAGTAWQAWTPLHGTTRYRGEHLKAAAYLLDAGAEVDAASPWGSFTPLHGALREADADKTRLLIARGADVNHRVSVWQHGTLLHEAVRHPNSAPEESAAVVDLMLAAGADVNATDAAGRTPLDVAFHPQCAAVLRSHGGAGTA